MIPPSLQKTKIQRTSGLGRSVNRREKGGLKTLFRTVVKFRQKKLPRDIFAAKPFAELVTAATGARDEVLALHQSPSPVMPALQGRAKNRRCDAERQGRASRDLLLPTTFLLDKSGVIRWVYRPDAYRVRAPAAAVLRAIDALD